MLSWPSRCGRLIARLRDLGGAVEPDPGRRQRGLDRAAGPAAVVRAHGRDGGDACPGQLFQLPVQRGHVALDGHHVIRAQAEDDLRGVALRVHRVLWGPGCYADLRRDLPAALREAGHEIGIIIPSSMKGMNSDQS